ncbi:Glutathione-dependent formaldehyde-activating enzyme [Halioglobus japonicus]|nr:Glutathione-dependent formaldehyde-activating enzyme [Halioglobus japonicus]
MNTPLSGSCQCGAVTYTVSAEPLFTYACHCHSCQKRTGSAFSLGLVIATETLDLEGALTPWKRVSEQGNSNTRYSCASCGNIIYGIGDTSPELAKLQAGTLEDTSAVEPEVHMWTVTKQPWIVLPEHVQQFETQPEDGLALLQAALDYRAKARDE